MLSYTHTILLYFVDKESDTCKKLFNISIKDLITNTKSKYTEQV